MPEYINILNAPAVLAAIQRAWADSRAENSITHEEGGFITKDVGGNLGVVRWPSGGQDSIRVPAHPKCKVGDRSIVATFHTHPNTAGDYLQEPSETDRRAVRDDLDLKDEDYVGEFVISYEMIFLITPAGRVREIAQTQELFDRS
jgi:hypothetical protein